MDLELRHSSNKTKIRIINAYGPTAEKAAENPSLIEKFYSELEKATKVTSNVDIWILGDFNARIGQNIAHEEENEIKGRYGFGEKNKNGEKLTHFLFLNSLFVSNTAFKHSSKNRITWNCTIKAGKEKIFKCDTCDAKCKSKSTLERHKMKMHKTEAANIQTCKNKQVFNCESCTYTFTRKSRLKTHTEIVHNKKQKQNCTRCTFFTYKERKFKEHNETKHENEKKIVRAQIDYIICKQNLKPLLENARSYGGLNISTDHKLVKTTINLNKLILKHPTKKKKENKYNTNILSKDANLQNEYRKEVTKALNEMEKEENPNINLENGKSRLKEVAKKYCHPKIEEKTRKAT